MNRQIKFKGRRKDNGEWVFGFYGIQGKGTDIEAHFIMTSTLSNGRIDHFINPETLGQFTGLKDKNGVEIYEGDTDGTYVVEFKDACFWIIAPNRNEHWIHYLYDYEGLFEVKGNIHDNPELLK